MHASERPDADLLVLFDIDGTLLLSDGAGAKAMQEAGKRVVGERFTLEGVTFAGRLDPLIWADGARRAGVHGDGALHARFRVAYTEALARRLSGPGTARALPGVDTLLAALAPTPGITLGILTGNYPETGRIKLEAAGLSPARFPVTAWGCDGVSRRALPGVAMERYEAWTGRAIEARHVVVVGDTVHDVDCAHHAGCAAIAVATGPTTDLETLRAHDPELLLEDLSDTERVLAFVRSLQRTS